MQFVRGNTDRYVVTGDAAVAASAETSNATRRCESLFDAVESSFAWTHARMADAGLLDALAALPDAQRMVLADGTRVLGIHASPQSDDGAGIRPDLSDADLAGLLAGSDADIVCGGHTHRRDRSASSTGPAR